MIADSMKKLLAMLAVGFFAVALSACEEQGAAEQTGEAIDNAVEEAGDAAEEATTN